MSTIVSSCLQKSRPSSTLVPRQFYLHYYSIHRSKFIASSIFQLHSAFTSMASSNKKQRTQEQYELLYHPSIPGRGEFIRLVFEAAGVSYTEVAKEKGDAGFSSVMAACNPKDPSDEDGNPMGFAPPGLRVLGAGKDGKSLLIFQTPNIMAYLGRHLGLAGEDEADQLHISQAALTALDFNNEIHNTHHPIGVSQYYEEQKEEALRAAEEVRNLRIPKYFSYFERLLKDNAAKGQNKYLVGSKLSYADLTLFQLVDGLHFAFPKEMKVRASEFPLLCDTFYSAIKEENRIKEYLASDRRLPFSNGTFRHYPELDRQ